ncbi:hypothetical protein [Allomesorhizobium camelthorni]|uniref:Uncharacterized protein n=1 Tax=Allomesorhizobium camelthorni TaxID=475069 RepID=A0A6G4WJ00_9HYPH|nr:hypothetical protein [Mesorhizobium camelthorni]NGO54206.1 hypothetical protein [Mesorhizobium camelthorni]
MTNDEKTPYRMNDAARAAQARLRKAGTLIKKGFQPTYDRADVLAGILLKHLPKDELTKVNLLLKKGIDLPRLMQRTAE